ncbi:MAG: ChaN family lipoprotein [Humidesulfovibrio sp.]|nr:ChaN family lipoprotein [Humidesulfovibrio sp.]
MPSVLLFRALAPFRRGRGAAFWTLALFFLLSSACARSAPLDQPMAISFLPAPGELLTDGGDPLSGEGFLDRAQNSAYVLIGEVHGNACDHEAEQRFLTLLAHSRGGKGLAVGLEMVPAKNSAVLQEFMAGKIAPQDLEARLDWARTWGHPFARYLPIFLALREWKLPVAGLNVSPEVIRRLSAAAVDNATASDPVAALSAEDRAQLPAKIIPPAPEQLEFLREAMAGHPKGTATAQGLDDPRQLARFQLIQSVWDSAMAEQAVRLRKTTGRQVAVLAGAAHVEGGLGIARRIRVLDPGAEILLVSPWRGDEFDREDAQVRVYCPISFESRMGMTLEDRPLGGEPVVVVTRVERGSRAEAAGLRPGDVLTRAGGYRMRSLVTLHLAGSDAYNARRNLVLIIRRGDACYTVDLGPLGQRKAAAKPGGAQTTAPGAASGKAPDVRE